MESQLVVNGYRDFDGSFNGFGLLLLDGASEQREDERAHRS